MDVNRLKEGRHKKPIIRRVWPPALLLACLIMTGGCSVLGNWVTSLVFFPDPTFQMEPQDLGLEAEAVKLRIAEGVELYCWYLPSADTGKPILVYLHGNAGNISHRLPIARGWVDRGYGCFLLDYRGYGRSGGKISHEKDLSDDAEAAYQWLRDERGIAAGRIVLYGESIGCAPAIDLACRLNVSAVILVAPFTRLIDMARIHYGSYIPESLVSDYRFDNETRVASIGVPLFLMHGTEDEIVPVEMGRKVFGQAPNPKESFWVSGGHHNDLPGAGAVFWDRPANFLASLSKPQ